MTRPIDTATLAAFSEELRNSLPEIVAALDSGNRDRSDGSPAYEAYRLLHSLKGAASMVGLVALGNLLHLAESALDEAITGAAPLSDELLAVERAAVPRLAEYMDAVLTGRPREEIAIEILTAFQLVLPLRSGDEEAHLRDLLAIEALELSSWRSPEENATLDPVVAVPADFAFHAAGGATPVLEEHGADRTAEYEDAPVALDPELAEVFAQESHEHLQTIARTTTRLSSSPDDRESLKELRRAVHTIKSAAGVVGLKSASRFAHRYEDLLDHLYDTRTVILTAETARVLSASSDLLDDMISGAGDPAALRERARELCAQFERLVRTDPAAPAGPAAPVESPHERASLPPAPSVQPAFSAEAAAAPSAPQPAPASPPAPAVMAAPPVASRVVPSVADQRWGPGDRRQNPEDRRSGGKVVRVPITRLNDLLRLVSELVINRSAFDQHYAALAEQVEELSLSTARLRRVAQKLETDYEVRALAGHLAPAPDAAERGAAADRRGFDELELDRYTDFHLLTRELGETASDIATVTASVSDTKGDFDGVLTRLGRLTREIQDKIMEFRMVPLGTLVPRLERAVRVTGEECRKSVGLAIEGEQVSLDRTLLEEMSDPLLHLLRNAVDHGIEAPALRRSAGKAERGMVSVRARHEGNDVVIEVEDDGGGLDYARIRQTAVEKGYAGAEEAASLDDAALARLLFEPGFSTAARISEVSGRGVGLDVVKTRVTHVNGRVDIESRPGERTTIAVRVPMTLAITRVLLFRAGGQTLGLPLAAVHQILRPHPTAISQVGPDRVITVDGTSFPLRVLADLLGLPHAPESGGVGHPVLIANVGGRRMAFAVDEIDHSRDAVVKTLGTHLRRVPGIWGATLLGDGTVVLILNPTDLAGTAAEPRLRRAAPERGLAEKRLRTVLIVDDSLSMRHVLSNAVARAGWNALQARDGLEALEIVHRASPRPDLILLDIEMPRMDGYEFLATMRGQSAFATVPIVMLTSRGGDRHREQAIALGATEYMVKPFQEDVLLDTINRLVAGDAAALKVAAS